MVTLRQRRALPASPASGWRWIGLLTAALFAFHVNYVRIHLLTEVHHSDSSIASAQAADRHDDHPEGGDHPHDHGEHKPHSASEHQLQMAGKQQSSFVLVAFLLPETSLFLSLPEPLVVYATFEHGGRPGESPPDPRQPRAPPTA
jgi:hypothetical protein